MLFLLLSVLSFAVAEPPVADSYLASRSGYGESPQQYLPELPEPSVRGSKAFTNTISDQYLLSSTNGISQEYGPPSTRSGLSQEYGTPNLRSIADFSSKTSQEYAPSVRHSQEHNPLSSLGHSFSAANSKAGTSQRYGAVRTSPSDVYRTPSLRSSPTTQYGANEFQSTNAEERNVPFQRNSGFSNTRNSSPVQKYGVPKSRSRQSLFGTISQEYLPSLRSNTPQAYKSKEAFPFGTQNPAQLSRNSPSQIYGTANSLATQYSAPEARNAGANYGDSSLLSTTYNRPDERSPTQEYGVPETGTALKSSTLASSYSSARSPSREYGAPSSRTAMPTPQYGTPRNLDGYSDQGYEYARNALEQLNQEPANYEFSYKVSDYESGSDFGHAENRQDDRAEGAYFVVLPDGTKQLVEYEADEDGFKPRISVIPADSASSRAGDGPY
ncbi:unnamed protein product [Parnassius mnemosyne]|uniref:Pro-resilin n=1 Tax=Parnassius mnemosyne TaxID=213953 RepID=A0AAV1LH67_9NEOP